MQKKTYLYTGSDANRKAVAWAVDTLRQAEVNVTTEDFEMPFQWQEKQVLASISGDVSFDPHVIAKPFSTAADAQVRRKFFAHVKGFRGLGSAQYY